MPAADLHGFSVGRVDRKDIAGPHHGHAGGEIDLIAPIDGHALIPQAFPADTAMTPAEARGESFNFAPHGASA